MKPSWSKILFIASDMTIGIYLLFAFSSFDSKGGNKTTCNKVNIEIADNATSGFIDTKIIQDRLRKSGLYPIGMRMSDINTRRIEETLRKSPFVKTAECYKTEGGHVYVSVTQRMPVIRIKADNGDDYYVDDNDCVMPTTKYTSDLIIATGNIDRWYATRFISPLGKTIMANDMWKNLIEQINVLPNHGIEIVPRVGDHIVHIGRLPDGKGRIDHLAAISEFMKRKMTRLEKFYRYGLSQVGWNKYSYIDIEFDNQIICRKRHDATMPTATTPEESAATTQPQTQDEANEQTENHNTDNATSSAANTPQKSESNTPPKPENKPKKTESDQKVAENKQKKTVTSTKKSEVSTKENGKSSKKNDNSSKKERNSTKRSEASTKKKSSNPR